VIQNVICRTLVFSRSELFCELPCRSDRLIPDGKFNQAIGAILSFPKFSSGTGCHSGSTWSSAATPAFSARVAPEAALTDIPRRPHPR
jgi:hypothetical protein